MEIQRKSSGIEIDYMNILVLGYFGYVTNQIDGQTIKTRDVYSLLENNCKEPLKYFDTQSFKLSKLKLLKMILIIIKSDIVFYLPAHNNLKYLFPMIYIISKLSNTKINYLVVGGWLYNFLENKPIHRYMLSKINGIYVETENLYINLKKYKFKNIYKLHNFRMVDFPDIAITDKLRKDIKLVFMARVHPLKGVDLIFELEKELKKRAVNEFSIDIYGPIFKDYEEEFNIKLKSSLIKYCGIVEPTNVYSALQKYDLMLFPTKYFTEGFPGSILDAYISGIPVVATHWLNAEEFIDDEITGYITEFNNESLFIDKIMELINNPTNIYDLKDNVKDKRTNYSSQKAWQVLHQAIYN